MYFDETAWVAIAFILFFVLVWKKGKQAIFSLLDERSLLIEKELNEAKSLKEEALEELRLALQNQKNIYDEADNIIKDAQDWFTIKDHHFCLICDYANLDPSFIIRKYKQLKEANAKKLFRGKNLNKFLTHYICSFHEDPTTKNYYA